MKKKLFSLALASVAMLTANAQNPYLPLWEHVPDGEPRVFEDPDCPGKYRAYIIGSHDVTYTAYCGPDIRMWSAPVEDLSQWRDEGPIFSYYIDGQWDTMFAPDLVEVRDRETGKKTYYLYPHSRGWRRVAMVCKGDRPDGPFTPINLTDDGRACVEGSMIDFDPSVFIEPVDNRRDPDYKRGYRAYVFYGFQHSTAAELDPETMYSVRPGTQIHDYFIPASASYGKLKDPEGTAYPALYKDQNPGEFNFFEASSIRQVGNKYVMVFSGYSGPEYGQGSTNSALRYAYGDTPLGPWRSGGVLVDSRGVVPDENGEHLVTRNAAHNTHGSLQQINGQWYVFYHRPPRGFGNARQAMVAPVKIEWDKKPVAKGGQVRITGYDPYAADETWVARAADGNCYTGAEVTSEGFQIFGLPPYAHYSAGIAAYMSDQQWLQDNHDVWNNSMELCGIKNGGIVGFNYFGFGGLATDTKGVKAFEGTKPGDGTQLNLELRIGSNEAFRVHVMLDGPYATAAWKGQEIATIDVPAGQQGKYFVAKRPVPAVEGLSGKHAIYFVVEGPDIKEPEQPRWGRRPEPQRPQGLCDMLGLSFSRGDKDVPQADPVPQITIMADGHRLQIPTTPLRFSNQNGYAECNRYQVYGRLSNQSQIEVTSSIPGVVISVGKIVDGRATVTCEYKGQKKIFLIN